MGSRGNILGIPEPQHLLFCPLQLLEMSFNCLEDVESTIPVSPLHLAVSPRSFPLAFLVPTCPRLAHRYKSTCESVLASAFLWGCRKQAVVWRGARGAHGEACCLESPCGPQEQSGDSVPSCIHWLPAPLQAYNGHCEALKTLAETLVNLDVRDHKGRTALFLATERGSTECVEVLTAHGASALIKERKRKWTPLHAAGECAL